MSSNIMEVSEEEFLREKAEIDHAYRSLKVGQGFRQTLVACLSKCGAKVRYPFTQNPNALSMSTHICFGDCMNINLEKSPRLSDLGEVPAGHIPKKFIWGSSLAPLGYQKPSDDEEGGDDE